MNQLQALNAALLGFHPAAVGLPLQGDAALPSQMFAELLAQLSAGQASPAPELASMQTAARMPGDGQAGAADWQSEILRSVPIDVAEDRPDPEVLTALLTKVIEQVLARPENAGNVEGKPHLATTRGQPVLPRQAQHSATVQPDRALEWIVSMDGQEADQFSGIAMPVGMAVISTGKAVIDRAGPALTWPDAVVALDQLRRSLQAVAEQLQTELASLTGREYSVSIVRAETVLAPIATQLGPWSPSSQVAEDAPHEGESAARVVQAFIPQASGKLPESQSLRWFQSTLEPGKPVAQVPIPLGQPQVNILLSSGLPGVGAQSSPLCNAVEYAIGESGLSLSAQPAVSHRERQSVALDLAVQHEGEPGIVLQARLTITKIELPEGCMPTQVALVLPAVEEQDPALPAVHIAPRPQAGMFAELPGSKATVTAVQSSEVEAGRTEQHTAQAGYIPQSSSDLIRKPGQVVLRPGTQVGVADWQLEQQAFAHQQPEIPADVPLDEGAGIAESWKAVPKTDGQSPDMTEQAVDAAPAPSIKVVPEPSFEGLDLVVDGTTLVEDVSPAPSNLTPQILQFTRPPAAPDYTSSLRAMTARLHELAQQYKSYGNGLYTAQLEMDPPALGKLFVYLSVQGGNVSMQVNVISPAARQQLAAGAAQLRQGLLDSGLNVVEMRIVSLDDESGEGTDSGQQQNSGSGRHGGNQGAGKETPRYQPVVKTAMGA